MINDPFYSDLGNKIKIILVSTSDVGSDIDVLFGKCMVLAI